MSALQRVLLSEDLASEKTASINKDTKSTETPEQHQEWTAIFTEVLFPLILRLLKPEVYQLDPQSMGETRVQAATLLCKIFLRYLDLLAALPPLRIERTPGQSPDATPRKGGAAAIAEKDTTDPAASGMAGADDALPVDGESSKRAPPVVEQKNWLVLTWSRTLSLLDRMLNSGVSPREQEVMSEAVTEGVKNCLLVMAGAGYLVPDAGGAVGKGVEGDGGDGDEEEGKKWRADLWRETERRVERVMPGLVGELFPQPVVVAASAKEEGQEQEHVTVADGGGENAPLAEGEEVVDEKAAATEAAGA